MKHKYFVVIPAHNEAKHIRRVIQSVQTYCKNIVIVNDGSTDQTSQIARGFDGISVLDLPRNLGKGKAMKVGAKLAWKMGAKGIIFMDADNQHHPQHIPEFIQKLRYGNDIVIGVRILKANIPWHRRLGNRLMVGIMRWLFRIDVPDMMCGYRAFSRRGYRSVEWEADGYGVETEMLTIMGRKRLPFRTVVVDTIYLDKYKGFSIWDGLRIVGQLPYYRMRQI